MVKKTKTKRKQILKSFEDQLQSTISDDDKLFDNELVKIKRVLDTFKQCMVRLTKKIYRHSDLSVSIHTAESKFQYTLSLELRSSGANYELLNFLFYPRVRRPRDDNDFPVSIIASTGNNPKDCQNFIDFENFLIIQAKNIHRILKVLSALED
jgi:hypothetical protein